MPSHSEAISKRILQVWKATCMRSDIASRPRACKLVHRDKAFSRRDKMGSDSKEFKAAFCS